MSPQEVMEGLLGRVASSEDGAAWFSEDEMGQWAAEAVQALKTQRLLKRGRDAKTALCDGCEEACVQPVHTVRNSAGVSVSFLLCEQRSDTNRVIVDPSKLRQWRASIERLCDFVATDLNINRSSARQEDRLLHPIGLFQGEQRGQMLLLRLEYPLMLVAGDQSLPLSELIRLEKGRYRVNRALVAQRVDRAKTGDERHTPSTVRREARKLETKAMYEKWRKAFRKLKKSRPNMSDVWYSQQIEKMECAHGRSAGTIKKNMK